MGDGDAAARQKLVCEIRDACETYGFFQLTGHGIPQSLLDELVEESKRFFSLPLETKEKYDKGNT
jgi:isopenicillin N synthase-like dioxygenase